MALRTTLVRCKLWNTFGRPLILRPDPGIVPSPKISGEWTVDKVLDTITVGKPVEGLTSPVPYFHLLERLKTMKREGWRRFGIER
jgi:putative hydrolase of HD superfamily